MLERKQKHKTKPWVKQLNHTNWHGIVLAFDIQCWNYECDVMNRKLQFWSLVQLQLSKARVWENGISFNLGKD